MLSDPDIERAASQLADYRTNNALPDILDKYSALLEGYRRLKSDYEEERDAREKYKQMARGQERNPFVLVLVDGDGYVFHESLLSKGADGGSHAAQLLHESIKASLQLKGLEHCQVMVRIYANLAGLSKTLHKVGLAGTERRSLAPFVASFNRSYGLAEFVDAGDLKENADFKLRAMMNLWAENTQCKHIYFAACHDVGYISDLVPYMGNYGRFTLINTPGVKFHDEFTKLDLGIEELPGVFRAASGGAPTWSLGDQAPTRTDGQKAVCRFHSSGRCKYGKACKNLHIEDATNSKATWRSTTNDPQSAAGGSLQEPRRRTPPLFNMRSDVATDFMNGYSAHATSLLAGLDVLALPKKGNIPEGQVAVNKNGFRLDPYIPPSGLEILSRLKAHISRQRVCNNFHLNGFCEAGDHCGYDHGPLEEGFKQALESLARSMPCGKRGACRNAACTCGHVCQNGDCKHRGGNGYCKLSPQSHSEELAVARYVPATNDPPHNRQSSSARASTAASTTDEDDVPTMTTRAALGEEEEQGISSRKSSGKLIELDSIKSTMST
ncbi:putative ccch zinc finger dna binding protein [Hirsutella rhossiliensis]|uniref:Ccch zinc finger dna binding protein n=1 Tax=Hirsutella rhossiliensis TaxID=111463 RepID=A0A9P8MVD1_9HYPO|nr:putative ccch zinc finger dna binding protein [Hirsutella rhossiliensis]KAH0961717.1 putative ccch zinc finger dna binding protein [Hirsutella rhossiliensis]